MSMLKFFNRFLTPSKGQNLLIVREEKQKMTIFDYADELNIYENILSLFFKFNV